MLGDVLSGASNVTRKGRLGPGQMVLVDLVEGTFKDNTAIAREVATRAPYQVDLIMDAFNQILMFHGLGLRSGCPDTVCARLSHGR